MTNLKGSKHIVEVTKQMSPDVIGEFEMLHKAVELTDEEKESSIETDIKK